MRPGDFYATKAISQIPRILSMMDRNEYSPSFGCFDRMYWLDKAIDFPSSIYQLNTHNIAMAYAHPYPGNIFFRKEKVRKWAFAGIDYWTRIQHSDGSFDEFYPNERGWAGPTGFLLFSMLGTYDLLKEEMPPGLKDRLFETSRKSADFLAKYDELGILANHHAMALLPIYYAYKILGDDSLLKVFFEKFDYFESLQSKEGWLLEYDGADLGYLSASVSFLGKIYKLTEDPLLKERILKIVEKAIEFSSYYVYPNGFYAGTIGSRQTLHFYPHGYEIFCTQFPLARKIADAMLTGLSEGKLVSPEIMPGRYLGYRVQEYLLTYLDYNPIEIDRTVLLPCERQPFTNVFPKAGMMAGKRPGFYFVVNFAKGGVVKVFNAKGDLMYNDCGIIGRLANGKTVTSQWIDKDYSVSLAESEGTVEGAMNYAPFKLPTPLTMMAFRLALLSLAWNTKLSYLMKGLVRDLFITRTKKSPVTFKRAIAISPGEISVRDEIFLKPSTKVLALSIGDEFSVRYVPQSLYFQSQELDVAGCPLGDEVLGELNREMHIIHQRTVNPEKGTIHHSYSCQ